MKIFNSEFLSFSFKSKNDGKSLFILIAGIILTFVLTLLTYNLVENKVNDNFIADCNEIELKTSMRLHANALILRSGCAYLSVSDTVTRAEWKLFNKLSKIEENLPGILGIGFSLIVPKSDLKKHIQQIQQEGFPNYTVHPSGDRELFTSILYLEPFSGRNLRAFGYDMFTEPIRRKAMELSRDNNVAMLSGKVGLVQETNSDIQSGTLMYVPLYKSGMPVSTVEERRAAIKGWVFSPFRMNDLMHGILGNRNKIDENLIRLQMYDDSISVESLMYDSQVNNPIQSAFAHKHVFNLPVEFNGKKWVLHFTQSKNYFINSKVLIIFIGGTFISFLLFLLSLLLFNIEYRSQQIEIQNNKLQKLNNEKDKFFSIIAHDLKSPFNSILGFSQILEEQMKEKNYKDVEKYAEIILKSSKRAMELLINLMEWSRSQTGKMKFNPLSFDIVELVEDVSLLFSDAAKQKTINLNFKLPKQLMVLADKEMISSVLRNLISNALKFTKPEGIITISAQKSQNLITILVKDNGIGIPDEAIDKLFQLDSEYSTIGTQNEKGTGLGLILCKEFVEKHGGKIWVESEKGIGSSFYFSLPNLPL